MAVFIGIGVRDFTMAAMTANNFKRTGYTARVAGKLHRRGIGQKLTLPADCCFDQVTEEGAQITDDNQT